MSDEADHVRALRFAGPILAEVLRAIAHRRRCGLSELAGEEVLEIDTAILRGIQVALARGHGPPPDIALAPLSSVYERPTTRPAAPPPLGALGPAALPWPPEPPASAPFNDPLEDTPAFGDEAKKRKASRSR